ncbi:uncharacterized protein HKW66_Vig0079860 [Vigna angularis]|uniref:Peptidase S9 prolyl oligopeptidase catalytic domain-containing protein n=1 Tax=Phaseolus angularis TaxID=3914 RepID=A0A8T0K608_PHAAN|nr:uncharacterized protein HKW66_Vig0079860 [Vigna angularis]
MLMMKGHEVESPPPHTAMYYPYAATYYPHTTTILHQRRRFFCHNCKRGIASSPVTIPSISDKMTAPYGSWKSPITTDVVSGAAKRLGGTAVDARGRLVWLESRPAESGRGVLVVEAENPGGEAVDITPKEFGVRTLAQEYGGGAFTVSGDVVFFANYKDQRLYQQSISSLDVPPIPLTPDYGSPVVSYADGIYDGRFNRFVSVREEAQVLVSGSDFYAFPRLDPKCERIAWIQWSHPYMPWDKSELWVGYISEKGEIYKQVSVAGNDPALVESPTEPKWSSDVHSIKVLVVCRQQGKSYLGIIDDEPDSKLTLLDIPFTDIDNIVISKIVSLFLFLWSKSILEMHYQSYCAITPLQTSGNDCLYVEGASAVSSSSVAKVNSGKVDGKRLCITGGSAGGYTTLAALAFKETFKAGASLYGVADVNLLRAETHKFESHYIDRLGGGEKGCYERSPINHVDKFSCPIILFQGLEDKVVPPEQARKIYQALKEKGVPVALVEYEGEQHGFRKAENIMFTLEQQMVFFARLVGHFNVADDITPIKIDNFD